MILYDSNVTPPRRTGPRRTVRRARLPPGARQPRHSEVGDLTYGVVNFKSISVATLEPRRITVLTGANSSGKSSLLQALLFFAQSYGEAVVVINGDLVRLGGPRDVIRDQAESLTLTFSYSPVSAAPSSTPDESANSLHITLDTPTGQAALGVSELSLWEGAQCVLKAHRAAPPPSITLSPGEFALRLDTPGDTVDLQQGFLVISGVTPSEIVYKISRDDVLQALYSILEKSGSGRQPLTDELIFELQGRGDVEDDITSLVELQKRFRAGQKVTRTDPLLNAVIDRFVDSVAPGDWITEPVASVAASFGNAFIRQSEHLPEEPRRLAAMLTTALNRAERLASAIVYLGPLRDDPRVAYPLGHTISALPVGEKGEFTAAYLLDNATEHLNYGTPEHGTRYGLLSDAVTTWCQHLGIADQIHVTPMGKLGHQLGLDVAGHTRDPTAIGVGASQLLPVIVLVLGAPEGAIILLEQPELHLHPKVQSRLADFFARARPNVRLVIETHSEYLLTRLRLRVAQGALSPDEVAVLFAVQRLVDNETTNTDRYTEFKALTMSELGDFNLWPEGFFDSLDEDAIALAEAVSARVKNSPRPDSA